MTRHFKRLDKQFDTRLSHQRVAHRQGVVVNIAAAYIQRPGDIIQRAQQVVLRPNRAHASADTQ